jgi:hypothetical protein
MNTTAKKKKKKYIILSRGNKSAWCAYIPHCSTLGIVQERDQVICRMRNNGTEDTSNVTPGETNTQLVRFAALRLWNRNSMLVNEFNDGLKGSKLHHGIWKKKNYANI